MQFLRQPLVHFLLLGAAIYGAFGLFGSSPGEAPDNTVLVTTGQMDWLAQQFAGKYNRAPTPEELTGLIRAHIREQVLYREALAMGLDGGDVIIRRRLAQKLEFLYQDLADMSPPSESEIDAYFLANIEEYQEPELITFTQVFFDPDRRGDGTLTDAAEVRDRLSALDEPTQDAASEGDSFLLQSYYPRRSQTDVAKLFGQGFARPLFDLEVGTWHGPVLSGYGVHLVYVHDRSQTPPPELLQVKPRVLEDLQDERRRAFNEEQYAALLARYNVVIENGEEEANEDTGDDSRKVVRK